MPKGMKTLRSLINERKAQKSSLISKEKVDKGIFDGPGNRERLRIVSLGNFLDFLSTVPRHARHHAIEFPRNVWDVWFTPSMSLGCTPRGS